MRTLPTVLLAAVLAVPSVSNAVPMVSGAIDASPFASGSLASGATESNAIRLIPEQQNVSITELFVDHVVTAGTTLSASLLGTPGHLSGVVSSFLLHFDPVGAPSTGVSAAGTVVFDDPIVGLIFNNNRQDTAIPTTLADSDAALGLAGVTYPATTGRRFLEGEGGDTLTVSAGSFAPLLRQLELTMRSGGANLDQLRVLTMAATSGPAVDGVVGEPGPLGLLLIAMLVAAGARARRATRPAR